MDLFKFLSSGGLLGGQNGSEYSTRTNDNLRVRQLPPLHQIGAYDNEWGQRWDDNLNAPVAGHKGMGWQGGFNDGKSIVTEYSSGDRFNNSNKIIGYPSITPNMTPLDIAHILRSTRNNTHVPPMQNDIARRFAQERLNNGLSPFVD